MKKKTVAVLISTVMVLSLFSGCGKSAGPQETVENNETLPESTEASEAEDPEEDEPESELISDDVYESIITGDGARTAFIGEPFYDGVIEGEEDAMEAIYGVLDYLGGDNTTHLEPIEAFRNAEGTIYYNFRQVVSDVTVHGATVKLIADKDGKAIGLVSSLVPNLSADPPENWGIDGKEAEAIVKEAYKDREITIIPDATERTLLPYEDDSDLFYYAWVVYTKAFYDTADAAYLAHYVDEDGDYLYCTPVSAPGSLQALRGGIPPLVFDGYEEDTWSGTVKTCSGQKQEVEVPVMVDPDTGDLLLGDLTRQILVADFNDFMNNYTLTPCVIGGGEHSDEWILTFQNFIKIFDLYGSTKFNGPDTEGTPCLILVDAVDEEGIPIDNAFYAGKIQGFQVFAFDSTAPYGEAVDVMGHEFTHCFTTKVMNTNLYMNDYGAINEAMSDIFGNLYAMMVDETDVPYVMGEKLENGVRYMNDPHKGWQPEYVWDMYYLPEAMESTDENDNGGVHTNSSLLNWVSAKLGEAGMDHGDEFYYWMNVALAMTPRTDYPQMAQLLPFIMDHLGYPQYVSVIEEAIRDTRMETKELPESLGEGMGMIAVDFSAPGELESYDITASLAATDSDYGVLTYPDAKSEIIRAVVPEGDYYLAFEMIDRETGESLVAAHRESGWDVFDTTDMEQLDAMLMDPANGYILSVNAGETVEMDSSGIFQPAQ